MSELARYLCTFRAFDNSKSQNYVVSHSMQDAVAEVNRNPDCKEIISVVKIEDSGPKVRKSSGFVSNCLSDNLNSQITHQLERLHK